MRRWIPSLLIIVAVAASLFMYERMPERVPTHWNMSGEADGWSSRFFAAWLLPLMMAVILVILRLVPHIDPRRANYEKFRGVYEGIVVLILLAMLGMHAMLLAMAVGVEVPVERVMPAAVGVFFGIIGLMLPRAHPNWFIGIRTPWTLSSDLVWEKTHRLGAVLFVGTGLLTLTAVLLAPGYATWVLIYAGVVTVISVFAYSFILWKREKGSASTV